MRGDAWSLLHLCPAGWSRAQPDHDSQNKVNQLPKVKLKLEKSGCKPSCLVLIWFLIWFLIRFLIRFWSTTCSEASASPCLQSSAEEVPVLLHILEFSGSSQETWSRWKSCRRRRRSEYLPRIRSEEEEQLFKEPLKAHVYQEASQRTARGRAPFPVCACLCGCLGSGSNETVGGWSSAHRERLTDGHSFSRLVKL